MAALCWTPFISMLIVSGQRSWLKGTSNPAGEEPCASRWRRIIISPWEISAQVETLTNSCCMQRRHKKMSPWVCMLSITQLSVWNYSTLHPDKECFICTRCQTQLSAEKINLHAPREHNKTVFSTWHTLQTQFNNKIQSIMPGWDSMISSQ